MNFNDWIEINEIKAPKKPKISVIAHSDIDRWLKSVDGFARDLQDLKKAKEKSQAKLDQIGKKYKPEPDGKPEDGKPEDGKPQNKELEKQSSEKDFGQKPLGKDQKQQRQSQKPKEKEIANDKELPVLARKRKDRNIQYELQPETGAE